MGMLMERSIAIVLVLTLLSPSSLSTVFSFVAAPLAPCCKHNYMHLTPTCVLAIIAHMQIWCRPETNRSWAKQNMQNGPPCRCDGNNTHTSSKGMHKAASRLHWMLLLCASIPGPNTQAATKAAVQDQHPGPIPSATLSNRSGALGWSCVVPVASTALQPALQKRSAAASSGPSVSAPSALPAASAAEQEAKRHCCAGHDHQRCVTSEPVP